MLLVKLAIILPTFQVFPAVLLLAWGHTVRDPKRLDTPFVATVTLICHGINAPALFAKPLAILIPGTEADARLRAATGFGVDEVLFLIAVVVLWYGVARWVSSLRDQASIKAAGRIAQVRIVMPLLGLPIGVFLFVSAMDLFRSAGRWNNRLGNTVEGALILGVGSRSIELRIARSSTSDN